MTTNIQRLAEIDRTIHEPSRLMVVALLAAVTEADFQYLHQATGLTKGNLSVHLSKLETAGYITIEKTFRGKYPLTICRLTQQGRDVLDGYREIIQSALSASPASRSNGEI
jgi:DNA-binding transcriptional ArsR family regulator